MNAIRAAIITIIPASARRSTHCRISRYGRKAYICDFPIGDRKFQPGRFRFFHPSSGWIREMSHVHADFMNREME